MEYEHVKEQIDNAIGTLINLLASISSNKRKGAKKLKPFTYQEFTRIYTLCYNLCVDQTNSSNSEKLYLLHGKTFDTYLEGNVLADLHPLSKEKLLTEFVEKWRQHEIMTKWMRMMFRYLNRYYVTQNSKLHLEEVAILKFRTIVYDNLKDKFLVSVMDLINSCRDNPNQDSSLLSEIVQIFVELTGREATATDPMGNSILDIYTSEFEKNLLESTYSYYSEKASVWVNQYHISKYIVVVGEMFEFETKLAERYFQTASRAVWMKQNNNILVDHELFLKESSTLARMMNILRQSCLEDYMRKILVREASNDGFKYLLTETKLDDLTLLYSLFKDVKGGLAFMGTEFKEYVMEECKKIGNLSKKAEDIVKIVNQYVELHSRYTAMVEIQFSKNSLLSRSMKEAFERVINTNTTTEKRKITFAEVLSTYMDLQLKNKKIDEGLRTERLDHSIKLFLYLEEKDRFSEIYRTQLAKRLLNGVTDESIESPMILKFKSHLGGGYTNKMEGMVKDLMTGRGSKSNFQEYALKNAPDTEKSLTNSGMIEMNVPHGTLNFGVDLLTQGFWPPHVQMDLKYPPEMQKCLDLYKEYFRNEFDQKKLLNWVDSIGVCVISYSIGGNELELTLTTIQAATLMLFNDAERLHFQKICKLLNLEENICKKVLHSFFRLKVLKKEGGKNAKKIDVDNDVFSVNEDFKPKRNKFKVPMPTLTESHDPKIVTEDRKDAIDAAIVRIMKTRKKYEHNRLVGDVMQQLQFFRPEGKQIKQRIESLIDREYIERYEDDTNIYLYIS